MLCLDTLYDSVRCWARVRKSTLLLQFFICTSTWVIAPLTELMGHAQNIPPEMKQMKAILWGALSRHFPWNDFHHKLKRHLWMVGFLRYQVSNLKVVFERGRSVWRPDKHGSYPSNTCGSENFRCFVFNESSLNYFIFSAFIFSVAFHKFMKYKRIE